MARQRGVPLPLEVVRFTPFDPTVKMAEAAARDPGGSEIRIVKGAPAAIAAIAPMNPEIAAELQSLASAGYRILAVACGPPGSNGDCRADCLWRSTPARLAQLARRARPPWVWAQSWSPVTPRPPLRRSREQLDWRGRSVRRDGSPTGSSPEDFAVYAGVFPEDKFRLVKAFQQQGHAVGMCGDGANDAPALRQAQMGIAVSTATDVAKAAAGIVLTDPGLGRHRHLHQRRAVCISAGADLHFEHPRQQIRDAGGAGCGVGHDRARGADAAAAGDRDARRRFRDDVAGGGSGEAVAIIRMPGESAI